MQHAVLYGAEPRGLPLSEKLLPEYLNDMGYTSRMVGKWHLGSWKKEYLPTSRGFKSHIGYWTGHHDYNDHTAVETVNNVFNTGNKRLITDHNSASRLHSC